MMPRSVPEISEHFEARRFSWTCAECSGFAQELLAVPESERLTSIVTFYEALEGIMDGLYNNYCSGTLTTTEKVGLFKIVRDDWSDDAPGFLRASMVTVLNMLQPLEGVSEWLLETADRQTDTEYKHYLRDCAIHKRTTPGV
jgi:hypothetical protein